jgi:hypothetical protein
MSPAALQHRIDEHAHVCSDGLPCAIEVRATVRHEELAVVERSWISAGRAQVPEGPDPAPLKRMNALPIAWNTPAIHKLPDRWYTTPKNNPMAKIDANIGTAKDAGDPK